MTILQENINKLADKQDSFLDGLMQHLNINNTGKRYSVALKGSTKNQVGLTLKLTTKIGKNLRKISLKLPP